MEAAGHWLREERERRHIKGGEFARTIGIDPSQLSRYERGISAVPDDRAQKIAEVFGLGILTVRRNLGLWVPETAPEQPATRDPDDDPPPFELRDEVEEGLWALKNLSPEFRRNFIRQWRARLEDENTGGANTGA